MTSRVFLVLFLFVLASHPVTAQKPITAQKQSEHALDASLLELGSPSKLTNPNANATEFKIVSYNIRWRSGEDLRKLIELFRTDPEIGGATVLGLQEVDRNKKRTGNTNTVKQIAEALGMHYAWAAPPTTKATAEEETGVAILSVYPLREVQRIVLPHPGPGKRRRVALGASIKVGAHQLRFYSVHSETRISVEKKVEQMKAAVADLANFPPGTPAIILGDFNTWDGGVGDMTRKMFKTAGFHTPFNDDATFCRRILLIDLKLRLDWVWLRDLEVKGFGVDRKIDYSDHWPLWVTLKFKPPL